MNEPLQNVLFHFRIGLCQWFLFLEVLRKLHRGTKKNIFLVPLFLVLFLGLFGALIQKNALDRPHQL
jgi:ABC-type enterochelin transport system permease subunit